MADSQKDFDLIVIGAGPAGIVGATTAAQLGKNVAIVDRNHELGGAGSNTGTVPSKTLRETALALSGMRTRDLYGVDLSLRREATVSDFLRHERDVKTGMNHLLSQRMQRSHTTVCWGKASFEDPHTVRVHPVADDAPPEQVLRGEQILIAIGSAPVRPEVFPFDHNEVYDSDTVLDLDRLPPKMAVVGAGVIGSEYACTFRALGSEVHLLDGRDALLPYLDSEVSRALAAAMERNGIVFHWKEQVHVCSPGASDGVTLSLSSGATLTVNAVLVAAGRKSDVQSLNLQAAGVTAGEHGRITVDDHYRTNVPHIYAAGDVIGYPALASTSAEQARRAIRYAFGVSVPDTASLPLPTGVYTIPEVGMVGETEQSLTHAGTEYVVGRGPYSHSARGRIIGDTDGFLKLLFRRSDLKLLGVHAIGEQATELVHIGLMALTAGASAEIFDEACFNIPTLGALYKVAALDAIFSVNGHERS